MTIMTAYLERATSGPKHLSGYRLMWILVTPLTGRDKKTAPRRNEIQTIFVGYWLRDEPVLELSAFL